MNQKIKIVIGITAFVLFIAGAMFAYNTLRGSVNPKITLAEKPGNIPTPIPKNESSASDNNSETELLKAPDFTVEDFDGNHVKLSEMEGKPVVLNFWASWCPPCKAEMPEFDTVYQELGDEVVFMMVNMTDGQRETKEIGDSYVSKQGYTFPVYYDTNQEAAYSYGIRSIPTTIFIDSSGYIITGAEGQIDEETLRYGISLIQSDEPLSDIEDDVEYRKLSADEAYEMMNELNNFILLDVRTEEEYQEMHIKDAVLIPDYEILSRAENELPNKDALILIYCRSGRRSAIAAKELVSMGYTNIYDFGGIINWPYDIE